MRGFRVWNEREKTYDDGWDYLLSSDGSLYALKYGALVSMSGADYLTVELDTGLKDKNGKAICEGDIVKIKDDIDTYGMNAGEVYEVYSNAGGFRLKPKYKLSITRGCRGYWMEDGEDFTAIGNIHENPKLLGDANATNKEEE